MKRVLLILGQYVIGQRSGCSLNLFTLGATGAHNGPGDGGVPLRTQSASPQEFFHVDLRDVANMKRASKGTHFSQTLCCGILVDYTRILAAIRNLCMMMAGV